MLSLLSRSILSDWKKTWIWKLTLDPVCIPGLHHPAKSNLCHLTCKCGDTISCQAVLHVKFLLVYKVYESPFQWVVYPVVDLWPHPFNNMILEFQKSKNKSLHFKHEVQCSPNKAEAEGLIILQFSWLKNAHQTGVFRGLHNCVLWADALRFQLGCVCNNGPLCVQLWQQVDM